MKKSFLSSAFASAKVTRARLMGLAAGAMIVSAGAVAAAPGVGQVGSMAYDFTNLMSLGDTAYSLKDFRGKVILLMTVQWNCGGCNADADSIGTIAMRFQGKDFQAFGPDINKGSVSDLKIFEKNLKKTSPQVNFPLLRGIPDNQIDTTSLGTKWTSYDALRDVFFVIDHTGKIVNRIEGNRTNSIGAASYKEIGNAIATAIANIPTTSVITGSARQGLRLQAYRSNGGYRFDLASAKNLPGNISLRIMDNQGRIVRDLDWNSEAAGGRHQALWDGMDARGNTVAWGNYYLNATGSGQSITLLLSWLP